MNWFLLPKDGQPGKFGAEFTFKVTCTCCGQVTATYEDGEFCVSQTLILRGWPKIAKVTLALTDVAVARYPEFSRKSQVYGTPEEVMLHIGAVVAAGQYITDREIRQARQILELLDLEAIPLKGKQASKDQGDWHQFSAN
jgi:hypothetical protein